MTKKIIVLLITIIFTASVQQNTYASMRNFNKLVDTSRFDPQEPNQNGVLSNLGPYKVGFRFCKQIQAISSILQVYSKVNWPVAGVGFTFGLLSNTSVVMELCQFIVSLENLNVEQLVYASARFLNTLTNNRWAQHFKQADILWNTANSIYDPKNGEFRAAALTSASTHRQLMRLADHTKQWYNGGQFDGKGERIERRADRRRELSKIARLSYKRALLQETSDCPEPPIKKDFMREYRREVSRAKREKTIAENDIRYIERAMGGMGRDIYTDNSDYQRYLDQLRELIDKGYRYETNNTTGIITRTVPSQTRVDDQGYPALEEIEEPVIYQEVKAQRVDNLWNQFRVVQVPTWRSFINKAKFTNGLRGSLSGRKDDIIEKKYRNYNYECSRRRLDRNMRLNNDEWLAAQERCKRAIVQQGGRGQVIDNLMEFYINQLQNAVRERRQAQADIWTFESKYSKEQVLEDTSRKSIDKKDEELVNNLARPETSCKPEYSPGQMAELQLEQQKLETEINQAINENQMKSTLLEEAKAEAEAREKQAGQDKINKAKKAARDNDQTQNYVPSNPRLRPRW